MLWDILLQFLLWTTKVSLACFYDFWYKMCNKEIVCCFVGRFDLTWLGEVQLLKSLDEFWLCCWIWMGSNKWHTKFTTASICIFYLSSWIMMVHSSRKGQLLAGVVWDGTVRKSGGRMITGFWNMSVFHGIEHVSNEWVQQSYQSTAGWYWLIVSFWPSFVWNVDQFKLNNENSWQGFYSWNGAFHSRMCLVTTLVTTCGSV